MKVQKFEKYKWNIDSGNIATEYAKVIISKYIDEETDTSVADFERIYLNVINGDELDTDQADIIKSEMIEYLEYLTKNAKKIRPLHEIEAEKYNL